MIKRFVELDDLQTAVQQLMRDMLLKCQYVIPAVPHEMTARELYSAYMRICEEYNHKGKPVRCDECPLYIHCPRIGGALRMAVMCSPIVEKFAKEHPEERS
jgi:hypothetical protein